MSGQKKIFFFFCGRFHVFFRRCCHISRFQIDLRVDWFYFSFVRWIDGFIEKSTCKSSFVDFFNNRCSVTPKITVFKRFYHFCSKVSYVFDHIIQIGVSEHFGIFTFFSFESDLAGYRLKSSGSVTPKRSLWTCLLWKNRFMLFKIYVHCEMIEISIYAGKFHQGLGGSVTPNSIFM